MSSLNLHPLEFMNIIANIIPRTFDRLEAERILHCEEKSRTNFNYKESHISDGDEEDNLPSGL